MGQQTSRLGGEKRKGKLHMKSPKTLKFPKNLYQEFCELMSDSFLDQGHDKFPLARLRAALNAVCWMGLSKPTAAARPHKLPQTVLASSAAPLSKFLAPLIPDQITSELGTHAERE
jgi:hypothetical protein